MGYNGEKAALNQYTQLKEYLLESGAIDQIKKVFGITENFRKSVQKEKTQIGEKVDTQPGIKPFSVLAFDAGLARFFKDSPYEVVVLKIAGGGSNEVINKYSELTKPSYLHVFTGLAKNPRVFSAITKKEDRIGSSGLAAQEVSRIFERGVLASFNELLNECFSGDFQKEVEAWIQKATKLPEIDNLAREFAEWLYVLRAAKATKGCDVLIVKDGSLITNQFGSGEALSKRLQSYFSGDIQSLSPLVVGVVKESRFIKDQGHIVSRAIWGFAKKTKGSSFFKIPPNLEAVLDPTPEADRSVDRYFLSIASGKNVFEVQFPKALTSDSELFQRARATIISQITSMYGGSVIANSLAHKAASLSEAEAQALEKHIRTLVEVK